MSMTEIKERWEVALDAAEQALSRAVSIGALSPSAAAESRGKLAKERDALRTSAG